MRKIIIFVLILTLILLHFDIKAATARKIDLKTKENEISIVFLKQKENISVLIDNEKNSKLFLIKLNDKEALNKSLSIFNKKPEVFWLDNSIGDNGDIYISKKNYIKMEIKDYSLCIVKNKSEASNCDFVYLLELDREFEVNEKLSVVFYDENINDNYLGLVNESWIDSHIVSTDSIAILKISSEGYNILVIPLANK